MLKTILKWGAIILLIFFIITAPVGAADSTRSLGGKLEDAAHSATTFFQRVTR